MGSNPMVRSSPPLCGPTWRRWSGFIATAGYHAPRLPLSWPATLARVELVDRPDALLCRPRQKDVPQRPAV